MPPHIVQKIVQSMASNNQLEYFENKIIEFKVVKEYKRRLSHVYVVNISFKDIGLKSFCIKIVKYDKNDIHNFDYNKKKLIHEFNSHKSAYDAFQNCSQFSIIKPIAIYPQDLALVTESFIDAVTLESLLTKTLFFGGKTRINKLEKLMFSSGQLLNRYHKARISEVKICNEQLKELREYILVRLKLIDTFIKEQMKGVDYPRDYTFYEKVFSDHLIDINKKVDFLSTIHGDFTPANILYNGNKLGLIDFSDSNLAATQIDIGSFLNYLNMLLLNRPMYDTNHIEKLKTAFIQGYSTEHLNKEIIKLYEFRYLTTNLLTQVYEVKKSKVKFFLLRRRIKRYILFLENYNF